MTDMVRSHRPCPTCNATNARRLAEMNYALFDDLNTPSHKFFVQCLCCGLLFDDTELTEEDLNRYYRENNLYNFAHSEKLGITFEPIARFDKIIDLLISHNPEPIRLLDVGCNRGAFLSRCLERGFTDVAGVELSESARRTATESGLRVVGHLDELSDFKPDCILMTQLLEHLLFPRKMLASLTAFAPGALIFLEVPATEAHFNQEIEWFRFFFEHLNHYTQGSLRTLGNTAGIAFVDESHWLYSDTMPAPCIWYLGRLPIIAPKEPLALPPPESSYPALPQPGGSAIDNIPEDGRPIAFWGISFYTMLLLGSREKLSTRTRRLFDASPTKIGRSIRGITIEPSSELSRLTDDYILIIPKSYYREQMRSLLPGIGFTGTVVEA